MKKQTNLVVTSRERDLGGFSVRRLLPSARRRMVGPFIFLDHMGPATFAAHHGLDVRPHPHIGLATVTYLFEGVILHRDSLGIAQEVHPGDVNWMVAGRGIVHSERTPQRLRDSGSKLEGIQCWIALPREHEETCPAFVHHPGRTLPSFTVGDVSLRLLLGTAYAHESPVRTFSDMLYLEAKVPKGATLRVPGDTRDLAAYVVGGCVEMGEERVNAGSLIIGAQGCDLTLRAEEAAHVMILGGEPLTEEREIWWNFVSSSKERLARAKADWKAGRFAKVPGDEEEFIPLPEEPPAANPPGTIL